MPWRLAHISRDGDDYVVTVSDDPLITARSPQVEQALERVKRSLFERLRDQRRQATMVEQTRQDITFDGTIALIETPDDADNLMAAGSFAARRRSVRLLRAQDARVQTGSLLARSRIRNTTSP
jgi:hypothetical protein